MSAIRTIGRACRRAVRVVAVIGIMSIGTAPAHAAPVATETILGITRIGRPADGLAIVNARVDLPAGARWTTDPDAGPLWLTVADGSLEIELGGGLGRIERKPDLFLGGRITPLEPGRVVALDPGDRVVVVDGFQLTAFNDGAASAVAFVRSVRQTPPGEDFAQPDATRDAWLVSSSDEGAPTSN